MILDSRYITRRLTLQAIIEAQKSARNKVREVKSSISLTNNAANAGRMTAKTAPSWEEIELMILDILHNEQKDSLFTIIDVTPKHFDKALRYLSNKRYLVVANRTTHQIAVSWIGSKSLTTRYKYSDKLLEDEIQRLAVMVEEWMGKSSNWIYPKFTSDPKRNQLLINQCLSQMP